MKKLLMLACTAAIGVVAAILAISSGSAKASSECVQYPSHDAYLCVAVQGGGALYWTDYLYTRQFYWHPAPGDLAVTESFYCYHDPTTYAGHTDCLNDAPGVNPLPDYDRRVITLSDGCIITNWPIRDTVTKPPAPTGCVNVGSATSRATSAQERASVLAFWQILQIVPGDW